MGTAYSLGTINLDSTYYTLKSCTISGGRKTTQSEAQRQDEGKQEDGKAKGRSFQFVVGVRGTNIATYEAALKDLMAALNTGLEIKWYGHDTNKYYNVLIGDISDPFPQQMVFGSDVMITATAADPFRYYEDAPNVATSTTSLLIAVASKTFTTQAGLNCYVGTYVRAESAADPTNYMEGYCTSYAGTTLVVDVQTVGGAGTFADWDISFGSPNLQTPAVASLDFSLYVNGDAYARPVITITGAFTGPLQLTNNTNGDTLIYNTDLGIGDELIIDCRAPLFAGGYQTGRKVTLNGTEDYSNFTGDVSSAGFLTLEAGLNELTFDSVAQGGTVEIEWLDRDWGGH